MAEKAKHDFAHTLDTHCTTGSKHFHNLEHNCALCDFSINDTHFPVDASTQFVILLNGISFNSVTESVNIPNAFQDIPSRGPPALHLPQTFIQILTT